MSNKFIINVKEFNINVQLKKIKHVYIRISNQNKITISAPINTNKKVIINFCLSKIKWIRLKLKQPKINYQNLIIDNNIYLWGEKYNINQLKKQNKDINKIIKDLYVNQIKNETFKILNFWEKKNSSKS